MMKKLTLIILISAYQIAFGQNHEEAFQVTDDVVEVTEVACNFPRARPGWKSIHVFKKGQLVEVNTFYKKELRSSETYEYTFGENEKLTKRNYVDGNGYFLSKTYYAANGSEIRVENFILGDKSAPNFVYHDYEYDESGRLLSRKNTSYPGITAKEQTDCLTFKYTNNTSVAQLWDSCKTILKTETITFDISGNAIGLIVDWHDSDAVITGARSENGVQRYQFLYDERGNWVKQFYVSEKGKKTLVKKRKIRYEEGA